MKRIVSLIALLALLTAMMCPILVSADTFVPSIGYKDGPDIIDAEMNDEDMAPCLVITSILAAQEKTTDIHQSHRDLLLEVYEKLSDGSMKLPLPDSYVVRELLDINFKQTVCIDPDHTHWDDLEKEDVTITVDFHLGVDAETEVVVLHYHDGQWEPIKRVVNNGDGTLTCEFEHFCPVAFCVADAGDNGPAQTGDNMDASLRIWIAVLAAAVAGIVILVAVPALRKNKKK